MIVPLKEIFNIFQFSTQIYTMWIFSWKKDDWEGKSLWIYELPPAPEIKSHLFSIGRSQILTVKINIFWASPPGEAFLVTKLMLFNDQDWLLWIFMY